MIVGVGYRALRDTPTAPAYRAKRDTAFALFGGYEIV